MMGLETIRALAAERAAQAELEELEPFVYEEGEPAQAPFPFPNFGDYVPQGWVEVDRHFADSSGFGSPSEPALTMHQLMALIEERNEAHDGPVGWAIVEEGQFQVYIGEFHRTSRTSCTCEDCQ